MDWTMREIQFLQDNHEGMTASEMGEALGRSRKSIVSKCSNLSISPKSGYTRSHYVLYQGEEIIAQGTKQEIAEQTGLSEKNLHYFGTPSARKRNSKKVLVKVED